MTDKHDLSLLSLMKKVQFMHLMLKLVLHLLHNSCQVFKTAFQSLFDCSMTPFHCECDELIEMSIDVCSGSAMLLSHALNESLL